jgi:hypothetical protein
MAGHAQRVSGRPSRSAADETVISPVASRKELNREHIASDFSAAVNLTTEELSEWLDTDTSKAVGWKGADGARAESVGHASGRRILSILQKSAAELTAEDYAHMRKVVGYVRRHLAQEPANPVSSRWRYSLMNWGHDPIKDLGLR